MISLLYKNGIPNTEKSDDMRYTDFMLDKIVESLTADVKCQDYFIKILISPLSDESSIIFRQEILGDFLNNRQLLERMCDYFSGFRLLVSEFRKGRKNAFQLNIYASGAETENTVYRLQQSAYILKKILALLKSIDALLNGLVIRSCGISNLKTRVREIVISESFSELMRLASDFEFYRLGEIGSEVKAVIDGMGKVDSTDLYSVSTQQVQKNSPKKFSIRKSIKDDGNKVGIRISLSGNSDLVLPALRDVADAFEYIIKSVTEEFGSIGSELLFYKTATAYCDKLTALNVDYCFPTFSDKTGIDSLYDLYLLFSSDTVSKIIPNDFSMSDRTKGVIIEGENSSGKTVYLRSVITAFLFAQAGLPVAARGAEFEIQNDIGVLMTYAENDDNTDDMYGRFEREVSEIKKLIERTGENSILFLNEIFQTTDYTEGAEALYHILNYFYDKKIKWVLVTHLKQLSAMYPPGADIIKLHTAGGQEYKVLRG